MMRKRNTSSAAKAWLEDAGEGARRSQARAETIITPMSTSRARSWIQRLCDMLSPGNYLQIFLIDVGIS
jgi:hypothetical protein